MKSSILAYIFILLLSSFNLFASSNSNNYMNLPEGFVYLDQVNNQIIQNLMYQTRFNFVGEKIDGYESNRVILTKKAAESLNNAWKIFDRDGYNIVIYDAYRPEKAVSNFIRWSSDQKYQNSEMKKFFFPYLDHKDAFKKGYIAERSSHSRGSTIDLTIIKKDSHFIPFSQFEKQELALNNSSDVKLIDGRIVKKLDDGTIDMGTSVDLMDLASYPFSDLISKKAQKNRKYFIEVMRNSGFEVYDKEWWHFTLKDEEFPDKYFNFDVK